MLAWLCVGLVWRNWLVTPQFNRVSRVEALQQTLVKLVKLVIFENLKALVDKTQRKDDVERLFGGELVQNLLVV